MGPFQQHIQFRLHIFPGFCAGSDQQGQRLIGEQNFIATVQDHPVVEIIRDTVERLLVVLLLGASKMNQFLIDGLQARIQVTRLLSPVK